MNEILIKLFLFFSTNGLPLEKDLQNPLQDSVIQKKLAEVIGVVPKDLLTFFGWKNGIAFAGRPNHFFDACYMYNLEAAAEDYQRFQQLDESMNFLKLDFKSLFPILLSGGANIIFIALKASIKAK